jgi:hypothetical protein
MGSFTAPIYCYWNPSLTDHYYSTKYRELGEDDLGWGFEKMEAFAFSAQRIGTVPLYRYWNPTIGNDTARPTSMSWVTVRMGTYSSGSNATPYH